MSDYTSAHTGAEIDDAVNRGKDITPGTALVNKALVLGASKDIDTIDVTEGGLKLGSVAITADAGEINKLDGLTPSTAELNILEGVTADKDEINIVDGLTATTAELNKADRSESDGIAEASKNLVLDANKDLLGKRYDINQTVLGLIASGPFMRFEAGLSPRMDVGDASDLDFADGSFSIVICALIDGTQELRIGKGAISSADQGYEVRFQTDGDIEVFVSDGSSYFINTSASPLGQYVAEEVFILVLSFDKSGNLTQTYNGVVQGALDISAHDEKSVSNSSNFYIDRVSAGGHSQYFLRFYNKALTLAEVRALTSGIPVTYADSESSMTNLITNGDMELDANWADYGTPTTEERSTTQKHSGTYSRKFVVNATNEGTKGDVFTTKTGKSYRHILWVYPSGTVVNVGIQKGDDAGWLSNVQYTGLNSGAWNRIVINVTETAGGTGAYLVAHSGAVDNGTWYVDDVWTVKTGCTVKYEPHAVFFKQWRDTNGGEHHGTIVGAVPESLPSGHEARYVIKGVSQNTNFADVHPLLYRIVNVIYKETASNFFKLNIGTYANRSSIVNGEFINVLGFEYCITLSGTITGKFFNPLYLTDILVTSHPQIPNGWMETNSGWSDYNTPTTNERSSDKAHGDTYSRKFVANDVNEGIQSDDYLTVTGRTYNYSIWVYPVSSTKASIIIRKGDNSGDLVSQEFTGLDPDTWNEITINIEETAGGGGAYIVIHSGTTAAGTFYVDDVDNEAWDSGEVDLTFIMESIL